MVISQTIPSLTVGTHYPNRLFVGALPGNASATDLAEFFKKFGTVLEGKVVLDNNGNSRRFGFITFATDEDVKRVLSHGIIFFRGKQINIGPAVKRMGCEETPNSPVSLQECNLASPVQCLGGNTKQVYSLHQIPEPVTPPVSPSTPLSPRAVFFRIDPTSPKNLLPNLPLSPVQPYFVPCLSVAQPNGMTNQQLPCLNVPYIGTSQYLPYSGLVHQPRPLLANTKTAVHSANITFQATPSNRRLNRPAPLKLPNLISN